MIRRYTWRPAALVLALLWLCMALPGFAAPLRELLEISVSIRPEAMVEPGEATLNFTIKNVSETDARNVSLSSADGLVSEPVGRIAAGEEQSFSRPHSVTAEELEAGEIVYIISHDDPQAADGKVNYTVRAGVRRSDARPHLEFTRQFSSRSVSAGGALTVSYHVRNSGNVALINLRVQDALGDFTGRIDRLEVGESRALISRVTVSEAAVSGATLTYNAEGSGDEAFAQTLTDVEISLAQAQMEHAIYANYAAFSVNTADVALVLSNTGNVDYRDIRVTDVLYGGVIADEIVLPAGGDSVEIRHSYALRGGEGFRWRVEGVTAAGDKIDFLTDVAQLPERETPVPAQLSISAEALTPRIRRSGDVDIVVRIANTGGQDVRDLALSEATLGDIRSFEILAAGSAIEREVAVHVTQDSAYDFSIRWQGDDGETKNITASPVQVRIAPDGVIPDGASRSFFEFTGNSIKLGGSSAFAVLLIVGCVVLLVLIVLLVIASRKARIEKQMRIAAAKQRRREEMGKTASFKPVRAAKKKGKKRTEK